MRKYLVFVVTLVLLCIFIFTATPASADSGGTLVRTPWEMNRGGGWVDTPTYPDHGDIRFYDYASIPPVTDSGWGPAPNGDIIGFSETSILPSYCLSAADFTYFQTFVTVPSDTEVTEFSITFYEIDDGARISIFNSAYPGGLVVPGSYVYLGGSGTSNLAEYVVAGETNRVVVTQVDDCPSGNNLREARVVLNGQVVYTSYPPTANAGGPYYVYEGSSIILNGSGSDPDGNPVTLNWDLDNDGAYDDATGTNPVFSAAGIAGPAAKNISLKVTEIPEIFWDFSNVTSVGSISTSVGLSSGPALSGVMSETGGGPAENYVFFTRFIGPVNYPYIDLTVQEPLILEDITFTHSHNTNSWMPTRYGYWVQLQIDSGGGYVNIGNPLHVTSNLNSPPPNSGATDTIDLNSTIINPGTHRIRWLASGFYNSSDSNSEYFAIDNLHLNFTGSVSTANAIVNIIPLPTVNAGLDAVIDEGDTFVSTSSGPVSLWRAEGNTLDSADGNDGTLVNNTTYAPGHTGQGFYFDGSGDYVEIPDADNLDVSGQLTLAAWIKQENYSGRFIDKISAGGNNGFLLDGYPHNLRMITNGLCIGSDESLPLNEWTHVAGTYDGATMKLYINGVCVESATGTGWETKNNLPVRLGADSQGYSCFKGVIDDAVIYDQALSESEIQALYEKGASGGCSWSGDETVTATVDYDDGSGVQTLALNPDNTFNLNHTYADDGVYDVTVNVYNPDIPENGSFESGADPGTGFITLGNGSTAINGWTVTTGEIDYIGGLWEASEGSRSLDLNAGNTGGISQTIDTVPGQAYRITFDMAGNYAGAPTVKNMRVSAGSAYADYSFNAAGKSSTNMGYETNSYIFTAVTDETVLSFTSLITGAYGPVLDNVKVAAVDTAVVTVNNVAPEVDAGNDATINEGQAFQPGLAALNPVSWWSAEGNANDVVDGNDGALYAGATITSGGISGQTFSFGSANDYVGIPASQNLKMTGSMSMQAWIYPTGNGVGAYPDQGGIIINKEAEFECARFRNGTIQWAFNNPNPGWTWINTGYVAPLNQWSHIVITYDNGLIKTYANGTLVHTYTGSGSINAGMNALWIGARASINHNFEGRIDEVAIFNRALTAQEITLLYNAAGIPGGSFTDPGSDTFTATVDYGDGSGVQPLALYDKKFNLNHTYVDDGVYTVTVTVGDDDGGTGTDTMTVTVNNVAPSISSVINTGPVNEGSSVTITVTATDPAGPYDPLTYEFDIDNDGTFDISQSGNILVYTFADNGIYPVNIRVTDGDGGEATGATTVTAKEVPPVLAITGPGSIDEGSAYVLGLSVYDPGDDTISSWEINWGDCNVEPVAGNPASVTHVYTDGPSSPIISAIATDEDGTYAANSIGIIVNNVAPSIASITNNGPIDEASSVTVTVEAADIAGENDPLSYEFDFDNDGIYEVSPQAENSAVGTYNDNGIYPVNVRVTDGDGGAATATTSVVVNDVPPTLVISGAGSTDETAEYVLGLSSSDVGDDTIVSWQVNWGDGNTDSIAGNPASVTYIYDDGPLTPVITAKATNEDGTFSANSLSITVNNIAPSISSVSNNGPVDEGSSATVTVEASDIAGINDPLRYEFDFDNNGSYEVGPQAENSAAGIFIDNGVYTVKVRVTDGDGGEAVSSTAVTVNEIPPVLTIAGAAETCEGDTYLLQLSSCDPGDDTISGWNINWGDGNVQSVAGNPSSVTHIYRDGPLSSAITATATDEDGTYNANSIDITVFNIEPTIVSVTNNGPIDEGSAVTIVVTATDPAGPYDPLTCEFDIDNDGIYDISQSSNSLIYTFIDNGVYPVNVRVTDGDGGQATGATTVTASEVPPVLSITGPGSIDEGSVYALGLSVYDPGDDTISDWEIDWGDGNVEPVAGNPSSVTHVYDDGPSSPVISATATDEDGTYAANSISITVNNVTPVPVIYGAPASIYEGTPVAMTSSVVDPGTLDTATGFAYAWTVTKDGEAYIDGTESSLGITPEDNGTYVVTLDVTDKDGATGTVTETINVLNAAPVLQPLADCTNYSGQIHPVTVAFSDAGILDTHTAVIDWGDGTSVEGIVAESNGSGTISGSYTYYTPGTYVITVTVTDKDGAVTTVSCTKTVTRLPVLIDIKPGSDPNSINLGNKGKVPVGILGGVYGGVVFDITTIDRTSVYFAGIPEEGIGGSPEDVNGDGIADLVLHFSTQDLQLTEESTVAYLYGMTVDGIYFEGYDSVRIVPEKNGNTNENQEQENNGKGNDKGKKK